jgi:hypothetical protein
MSLFNYVITSVLVYCISDILHKYEQFVNIIIDKSYLFVELKATFMYPYSSNTTSS